jgi:hypothetical protein
LKVEKKYRFSFTAGSLMLKELITYAKLLTESKISINDLMHETLNKEKVKTSKREFAELKIRLESLNEQEIEMLANDNVLNQKLIAYLSFCRTYKYFKDFIIEVVLEKISVYDYKISDIDYTIFFNKKCIDHDELNELTENTKSKIRQVIFKVLEQAGLIDNVKSRNIILPIIDTKLELLLKNTNPSDLQLLLIPQYLS